MSIRSEIDRIKNNVAESYDALEEKIGSVTRAGSDGLPGAIQGIQTFTTDDTLDINSDGVLGVANPNKFLSQEEYDALSDVEKTSGAVYMTPQQPCLQMTDNGAVPTGAVISFLGLKAPVGYLICDGTEYEIAKHPRLARFIEYQFEMVNFFGGDGVETFAVPDMRDLFLRGYNPDENGLSGEIGVKQEATMHPGIASNSMYFNWGRSGYDHTDTNANPDTVDGSNLRLFTFVEGNMSNTATIEGVANYTSRPVNMAVLYCIKY